MTFECVDALEAFFAAKPFHKHVAREEEAKPSCNTLHRARVLYDQPLQIFLANRPVCLRRERREERCILVKGKRCTASGE